MNLKSNSLLKIRAKRSSSETLIKRCAPDTNRNGVWTNGAKIFPELISDLLTDGHKVKFRAPGDSMYPTICNGDVITVTPLGASSVTNGDLILYQHRSGVTAHRVMRIIKRSEENSRSAPKGPQDHSSRETLEFYVRGDAAINNDAPVSSGQILGKVVSIERNGCRIDPYNFRVKLLYNARRLAARLKRLLSHSPKSP